MTFKLKCREVMGKDTEYHAVQQENGSWRIFKPICGVNYVYSVDPYQYQQCFAAPTVKRTNSLSFAHYVDVVLFIKGDAHKVPLVHS